MDCGNHHSRNSVKRKKNPLISRKKKQDNVEERDHKKVIAFSPSFFGAMNEKKGYTEGKMSRGSRGAR